MEPEDLPGADPNTLPYFITEAQTGRVVPVHFEPLTPHDATELQNEDWATAIFAPTWLQFVGEDCVFKLVRLDEQDKRIQGLLRVGALDPTGAFLTGSLLETAPFNRRNALQPEHHGVGSVLVARLAAESVLVEGQGQVVVQPRTGTAPFYEKIGFRVFSPVSRRYILSAEKAAMLMQAVLLCET